MPALLDLLVMDRDNPRSLAWVAQTLRGRLARLSGSAAGEMPLIAGTVPDPRTWSMADLCVKAPDGTHAALAELLQHCSTAAYQLSDEIGIRYFTHSGEVKLSLGA